MTNALVPYGILVTDEDNNADRVPCVLVLDCSNSMKDFGRIDSLNRGLRAFEDALKKNNKARRAARVMLIRVGGFKNEPEVKILREFHDGSDFSAPVEIASGSTPLGEAVLWALDMIEKEKAYLKQEDKNYYRPWLFVMSDGEPTDSPRYDPRATTWPLACSKSHEAIANGKVSVFVLAVDNADVPELQKLTTEKVEEIGSTDFERFFVWLSNSIGKATPDGRNPRLDFERR